MFLKNQNNFLKFKKKFKKMNIVIKRFLLENKFSVGNLYIDKKFYCNTIEDRDRDLRQVMSVDEILSKKVYSETAIPTGIYKVIIDYSNKYKRNMPHILNVKGFDGIRIHSGNFATDSMGCVLCGAFNGKDAVVNSRATTKVVQDLIQKAIDEKEEVTLILDYEEVVVDNRK